MIEQRKIIDENIEYTDIETRIKIFKNTDKVIKNLQKEIERTERTIDMLISNEMIEELERREKNIFGMAGRSIARSRW